MTNPQNSSASADSLRHRAEAAFHDPRTLWTRTDAASPPPDEIKRLIYELQVHQIELEMQNEELRRAQEEIEISRSRYFNLYDLAPVGYCTLDAEGVVLEANLTFATLLGAMRSTVVGQPLSKFIQQEDLDIYYLHRQQLFSTGTAQSCELRMTRNGDGVFWANLDATVAEDESDDKTCRLVVSDASERKHAEAENAFLEKQVSNLQKLESLGVLVAGVAHNLNNTLAAIMGTATLPRSQSTNPDDRAAFQSIATACERGRSVVRSLTQFAQPTLSTKLPLELQALLHETRILLESTTRHRVRIVEAYSSEPLWVVGDAGCLSSAVMNICLNAIDATPIGGTLTLRTQTTEANWAEVSIEDTGEGMTPEVLARVLDPFFTTKAVGKGTGLGLSMTHGVIKAHGGTLVVSSKPSQGTTVTFRIPIIPSPVVADPPAETQITPHGLNILLVDDDEDILFVVTQMLNAMGHHVKSVTSGIDALKMLCDGHHSDLIVLDQNMHGMDGIHTLEAVRAMGVLTPVLVASGQLDNERRTTFEQQKNVMIIMKPFSMHELQAKLEEFPTLIKASS